MRAIPSLTWVDLDRRRWWCVFVAMLWFLTGGAGWGQALPRQLRERILESVVMIAPYDLDAGRFEGTSGSGTVISPSGHLLTNYHVVGDLERREHFAQFGVFMTDPRAPEAPPRLMFWADYVDGDPTHDLALLEIARYADDRPVPDSVEFTAMPVGDSNRLLPGDPITVVGYPGISGSTITFTFGMMSGWLGEDLESGGRQWIKTDAKIARGNSGGAAFDDRGTLIGVPSRGFHTLEGALYEEQLYIRPIGLAWALIGPNVPNVARAPAPAAVAVAPVDTVEPEPVLRGAPSVETPPVAQHPTAPPPDAQPSVQADTDGSAVIGQLGLGQKATGALSGVEGASSYHTYYVDVPPGTAQWTVRLTADVDLDLAAKQGGEIATYALIADGGDCAHLDRSDGHGGTFEIDAPEEGRWYVDVINGLGPSVTATYLLEFGVTPPPAHEGDDEAPAPPADAPATPGDAPTAADLAAAIAAYDRGDVTQAFESFSALAHRGNAEAQNYLGYLYEFGYGVAPSDADAVHWYRLAADQGLAVAQTNLGYLIEQGRAAPLDDADAARWYRLAADQGDARAQTNLGWLHQAGRGVPQDFAEAARWYRLAAEQRYARALTNLGYLCSEGLGVPKDDVEAVRWYRLAAEQGDAVAQTNLGFMHEFGRGVPEDLAEAVRLYRSAAEQGDVVALTNLGYMYETGRGTDQDHAEAVRCYRAAAELGHARAQHNLGHLLEHGLGVEQDIGEARRWYRAAAEQDYAPAQEALQRLSETR